MHGECGETVGFEGAWLTCRKKGKHRVHEADYVGKRVTWEAESDSSVIESKEGGIVARMGQGASGPVDT